MRDTFVNGTNKLGPSTLSLFVPSNKLVDVIVTPAADFSFFCPEVNSRERSKFDILPENQSAVLFDFTYEMKLDIFVPALALNSTVFILEIPGVDDGHDFSTAACRKF